MNEINKINLWEQTKFRLSEIIGIENCFHQGINQRKSCSKKLRKYVTGFDYIDKILIALSTTSSGVCIISSASVDVIEISWNSKCKFDSNFFSNNRNNQAITKYNKKQKEKAR